MTERESIDYLVTEYINVPACEALFSAVVCDSVEEIKVDLKYYK